MNYLGVEPMIDSARHIPMASLTWDAAEAQRAIDEIVEDACARCEETRFWSAHPQDDGAKDGDTSLYLGAAGVIWALNNLFRTGATREDRPFVGFRDRLVEAARLNAQRSATTAATLLYTSAIFRRCWSPCGSNPTRQRRMQSMHAPAKTTRSPSAS